MLRLTGLPAPDRFPRATVRRAPGRVEILFEGAEQATQIDADLALVGPIEDLETEVLELLVRLQAMGYDVRWDRAGEDPAA